MLKIFTIKYEEKSEGFPDAAMCSFLADKDILKWESKFFVRWEKIDVFNCGWTSRQNFTMESQQLQIKAKTEGQYERTTTIQP